MSMLLPSPKGHILEVEAGGIRSATGSILQELIDE